MHAHTSASALSAKRRLLTWGLPLALVALAGAAWAVRLPSAAPVQPARPVQVALGAGARAEAVRALARKHRESLQRGAADFARVDPGYRQSLLAVDREFVRTLQGFSDEEKDSLWQLVRVAQEGVRRDEAAHR